jgi:hypothetical protein
MTEKENRDTTGLNVWKGRKKDKCRSRLFGTDPMEEEILLDHGKGGINKSRKRRRLNTSMEKKKK